jgi:hypothetical protein
MSTPNPLKNPELEFKSLLFLVLAATVLFALILWPFFGAVCWAVFIAIVFWPCTSASCMAATAAATWRRWPRSPSSC